VPAVAVPRMAVVAVVSVCPPGMCCVGHAQLPVVLRRDRLADRMHAVTGDGTARCISRAGCAWECHTVVA